MRTKLIILFCLFAYAASAQNIWITSRKSGAQIVVYPRKVTSVVNIDGEYFEGKVRPKPNYLIVGDNSVAYEEIGFLEVKKLESRSLLSTPLKWVGGGLFIIGAVASTLAFEGGDDESLGLLGAGVVSAGTGVLLYRLGEKSEPSKNRKVSTLHTREWQFSYGPRS